jgi:hypothetical protein
VVKWEKLGGIMIEKWLILKVKVIDLLRHLHLIPDVWYESEIELAKIRGKRTAEFFNKPTSD